MDKVLDDAINERFDRLLKNWILMNIGVDEGEFIDKIKVILGLSINDLHEVTVLYKHLKETKEELKKTKQTDEKLNTIAFEKLQSKIIDWIKK